MSASEFPAGTELVLAENREIEQNNQLDKNVVADHVWNTCRPSSKFSSSMPTVTARRIQLMRIQLQNNPRLFEVWETNVGDLDGEGEEDENDSSDYSSTEQYSGSSSKKRTSDKTSSGSDEVLPAEYSSSSCKKTVDHKHSECLTEHSSTQQCKKKISGTSSPWSQNTGPSSLDSRKDVCGKISVSSSKMPSSYRSSRISKRTMSEKSSHQSNNVSPTQQSSRISKRTMSEKSSHQSNNVSPTQQSSCCSRRIMSEKASVSSVHDSQGLHSSSESRKRVSGRSSEYSAENQQYSKQSSKKSSQKSTGWSENVSPSQRSSRNGRKNPSETYTIRSADVKMAAKHPRSSESSPTSSNESTDVCPEYTADECLPNYENYDMDDMEVEENDCDENDDNESLDKDYEADGDMGEEDEDDCNGNEEDMCGFYEKGEAMGNLCKPLCKEKEIHFLTCTPQHSGKEFVFTAKWNNRLIVFKSSYGNSEGSLTPDSEKSENAEETVRKMVPRVMKSKLSGDEARRVKETRNYKRRRREEVEESSEKSFEDMIRDIVADKLNVTITKSQLESLKYLEIKNKFLYSEYSDTRKIEKANLYGLLQSRQYMMSLLFADREMFPQLVGTCGHYFVVEHIRSPHFNSLFMLDDKQEWSERMKLAIEIMDFVEELETNFPDALHLCDIKMSHFGITNTGRLKYLDLDSVYTNNVVEKLVTSGKPCQENEDCDLLDCKSMCNAKTKICDGGVANNNLQVICEKIFIGWTMSGKVIVPGLLMSEHTPASLATLLRLCAENGRAPVPEDIRQRLYTTLTEMYQILAQRLSV